MRIDITRSLITHMLDDLRSILCARLNLNYEDIFMAFDIDEKHDLMITIFSERDLTFQYDIEEYLSAPHAIANAIVDTFQMAKLHNQTRPGFYTKRA
jgi:hypothetical protein